MFVRSGALLVVCLATAQGQITWHSLTHQTSSASARAFSKARNAWMNKDLAKAESLLRESLKQDPRNVDALETLGVLRAQNGDEETGCQYLETAAALDPDWPEALTNCAWCRFKKGSDAAAETLLHRSLKRNPLNPRTHFLAGVVMLRQGKDERLAIRHLETAAPKFPRARLILSMVHTRSGRIQEAEQEWKSWIAIEGAEGLKYESGPVGLGDDAP